MQIHALGSEIVECLRIARMIERHGELFLNRVFTPHEVQYCQRRTLATQHFAARWAAKKAVLRALGTSWQPGLSWQDVELFQPAEGSLEVRLSGGASLAARQAGVVRVLITVAHCRGYATATALGLRPAGESAAG